MEDMTNEYKQVMDIVRSWKAPKVDTIIEIAESENGIVANEVMDRICADIKQKRQAKFDSVFGVSATGVRLF